MPPKSKQARTKKGEQTKARIVEAALELFRQVGYEETTMRAVAGQADVSLGNAYYYFKSKEHLLHAYYASVHDAHAEAAAPALKTERDLHKRLLGVLKTKLEVIEPFHRFSGLLFRTAADPKSPLNPFHEDSAPARVEGTELFARVLEGSKLKIPRDIAPKLPHLLWVYSMGIVLFWLHDDSKDRAKTHALVEHSSELVVRVIKLLSNPILRPLRKSVLKLLDEIDIADFGPQKAGDRGHSK